MPGRLIPLITEQIYHVYNRGIDHRPTFLNKKEYDRVKEVLIYYRHIDPPFKLSILLTKSKDIRNKTIDQLNKNSKKLVDILSFCFMPNHFHLLLRQKVNNGIAKFMSNFQNSYTRYFNTKHKRIGPLFLDQFKAVRIETEEQLLHVSRYIHLNPYTSYVIKNVDDLFNYPWSSLPELLNMHDGICEKDVVNFYKNKYDFQKFIIDQSDYQRQLDKIKHLILDRIP